MSYPRLEHPQPTGAHAQIIGLLASARELMADIELTAPGRTYTIAEMYDAQIGAMIATVDGAYKHRYFEISTTPPKMVIDPAAFTTGLTGAYSAWLHFDDGRVVEELVIGPGVYSVRMYPEAIAAIEDRYRGRLVKICTDRADNVCWQR